MKVKFSRILLFSVQFTVCYTVYNVRECNVEVNLHFLWRGACFLSSVYKFFCRDTTRTMSLIGKMLGCEPMTRSARANHRAKLNRVYICMYFCTYMSKLSKKNFFSIRQRDFLKLKNRLFAVLLYIKFIIYI